jgi:hypothetical protein
MDQRKPRVNSIMLVGQLTEPTTLVLGQPVNGAVPLLDANGRPVAEGMLLSGIAYSRDNKAPKYITVGEARSRVDFDPDRRLLEFDHVFAVDTNTDPKTGRSVTVTAGITNLTFGESTKTCTVGYLPAIVWCSAHPSPERRGWRAAVQMITSSVFASRVAIFVDSDLDKLPVINARKAPILDEYGLPPTYELLYAASDRGTQEYIGNYAMGRCDRLATKIGKMTASRSDPRGWFPFVVTDELVDS